MMKRLTAPPLDRQHGVVMIFSLIVLLIMAIGAVALVRSMNTSLSSSGNLAFHRDLVNQGEQALSIVMQEFKGGLPPLNGVTISDLPAANYKASTLPSNAQGVPTVLLDDTAFPAVGTLPDIAGATPDVVIRYVIDRLCTPGFTGVATTLSCVQSSSEPPGGTGNRNTGLAAPTATVYRLSVRISGPRNTQAFLQTTFTKPD